MLNWEEISRTITTNESVKKQGFRKIIKNYICFQIAMIDEITSDELFFIFVNFVYVLVVLPRIVKRRHIRILIIFHRIYKMYRKKSRVLLLDDEKYIDLGKKHGFRQKVSR